jgi:hypothetical protein
MNIYNFFKLQSRKSFFVIAAAIAFVCMSARLADKANFSGEWTVNDQKSVLGQARFVPKKVKVEQTDNLLSLERTTSFNGEERVTPEKLTLDGKESENVAFGTAKRKSTVKWADDGQSLTINSELNIERNGENLQIKSTEVWKLLDAKTLSVETTSTTPQGTNTVKAVFDKK